MPDLSEEELKAIRSLIEADARRKWAVSAVSQVSIWIAGLAGGYLALKGMALEFLGLK